MMDGQRKLAVFLGKNAAIFEVGSTRPTWSEISIDEVPAREAHP
jgi:hypothetical protein